MDGPQQPTHIYLYLIYSTPSKWTTTKATICNTFRGMVAMVASHPGGGEEERPGDGELWRQRKSIQ